MSTPHLITAPHFHRASPRLNARLVMLPATHLGDLAVLDEALVAARAGLDATPEETAP